MTTTPVTFDSHRTLRRLALGIIVASVLFAAVGAAVTFITSRDRDLSIADTAIQFEEAVYGRNYEAMWDLSADGYRQGMTRDAFIAWARDNTPAPTLIYEWTALTEESGDVARVHTHFQLATSDLATNEMMLNRIDGEWRVVAYGPYDGPWPPEEPPLDGS